MAEQKKHAEQERAQRLQPRTWQRCNVPIPHRYGNELADENGKLLFKDNVFWPSQVANLHYCAHMSNGLFDCKYRTIPSPGKLLHLYCSMHAQEEAGERAKKEQILVDLKQLQEQELIYLLKEYKNA